jgi:hypothetical protein
MVLENRVARLGRENRRVKQLGLSPQKKTPAFSAQKRWCLIEPARG